MAPERSSGSTHVHRRPYPDVALELRLLQKQEWPEYGKPVRVVVQRGNGAHATANRSRQETFPLAPGRPHSSPDYARYAPSKLSLFCRHYREGLRAQKPSKKNHTLGLSLEQPVRRNVTCTRDPSKGCRTQSLPVCKVHWRWFRNGCLATHTVMLLSGNRQWRTKQLKSRSSHHLETDPLDMNGMGREPSREAVSKKVRIREVLVRSLVHFLRRQRGHID